MSLTYIIGLGEIGTMSHVLGGEGCRFDRVRHSSYTFSEGRLGGVENMVNFLREEPMHVNPEGISFGDNEKQALEFHKYLRAQIRKEQLNKHLRVFTFKMQTWEAERASNIVVIAGKQHISPEDLAIESTRLTQATDKAIEAADAFKMGRLLAWSATNDYESEAIPASYPRN